MARNWSATIARWCRQHRPDVILSNATEIPQWLRETGLEKSVAYANLDATLASAQTAVSTRLDAAAEQAHAAASRARVELLWSIVIGVAVAGAVIVVLTRHALLVEREQSRQETAQSDVARRIAFESSLQSALEMSRAEASVFGLVSEAAASHLSLLNVVLND